MCVDEQCSCFVADNANAGLCPTVLLAGVGRICLVGDTVDGKVLLDQFVLVSWVAVGFIYADRFAARILDAFEEGWELLGEVPYVFEGDDPVPIAVVVLDDFPVVVAAEGFVFQFVRRVGAKFLQEKVSTLVDFSCVFEPCGNISHCMTLVPNVGFTVWL